MDTFELDAAVHEARKGADAAHKEYDDFMKTVEPTRSRLQEVVTLEEDKAAARLKELFAQVTLEDLYDPLKASVFYELGWNRGRGINGIEETLRPLLANLYISSNYDWYTDDDYVSNPVIVFKLAIPKDKDLQKLQATADVIEKLYKASREISDRARIGVFEDSLSRYGSFDITEEDGVWELSNGVESESLFELLKRTPTYY